MDPDPAVPARELQFPGRSSSASMGTWQSTTPPARSLARQWRRIGLTLAAGAVAVGGALVLYRVSLGWVPAAEARVEAAQRQQLALALADAEARARAHPNDAAAQ